MQEFSLLKYSVLLLSVGVQTVSQWQWRSLYLHKFFYFQVLKILPSFIGCLQVVRSVLWGLWAPLYVACFPWDWSSIPSGIAPLLPDGTSRACSVLFMEHLEGLTKAERHSKLWALVLLRGGKEHEKEVEGRCLIPASFTCLFLSPAVYTALAVEWYISGCHGRSLCQA